METEKILEMLENLSKSYKARAKDVRYWAGFEHGMVGKDFARGLDDARCDLDDVIRKIRKIEEAWEE